MSGRVFSRFAFRAGSVGTACAVVASMLALATSVETAGASPAWVQQVVTSHVTAHVICRAYGGAISANNEADQDLGFKVTAPDGVLPGETFNIKIRPDVSLYPRDDRSV